MKKDFKIENIYLVLGLMFGVLFVFLIPPFNSPDEDSHFKRAYTVSKFDFYPEDNGTNVGNYFPTNMIEYINIKKSYIGNRDQKESYSQIVLDAHTLKQSDEKTFEHYSTVAVNPMIYTGPALGMIFTKIISVIFAMDITIPNLLYGGRIFSLVLSVLTVFFAIKISPKFKRSMFALALMPMTIFLFSCISYDAITISLTFLLFAITMKYKYGNEKKISGLDTFLVALIAFVYLNIKFIYVLNLLMVLLIPWKKFDFKNKDTIKKYIKYLLIFIGVLVITKLPYLLLDMAKYDKDASIISTQKTFVLNHPFKYLSIYFNTLFKNRYFYLTSFVGILGLIDTFLPIIIIAFYYIFLFATLIVDGSEYDKKVKVYERLLGLLVPFAIISLAFLGMYVIWTSLEVGVGAKTITGVQGRYFIPAFVFFPILFVNKFKLKKLSEKFNYFVPIYCLGTLIITTLILLLRFWI